MNEETNYRRFWLCGLGCAVVSYKNVVKSKEKTKWLCTKRSINSKEMS